MVTKVNGHSGDVKPFQHPATVSEVLTDTSLFIESAFIAGEWVQGSSTFPVYDPATNGVIANIANLDTAAFKKAIDHAAEAFVTFKETNEHYRSKLLHAWAALIRKHAKDLAVILTMENGKTLAEAQGEVEYGASFISWFAEEAIRSYGDVIPSQHPNSTNLVIRQPIGVCGIIAVSHPSMSSEPALLYPCLASRLFFASPNRH